jgi:acyl transferase domain-containing protein
MQLVVNRGGLLPAEVQSIQSQGLGSALADPIEVRAIDDALNHARTSPLAVGSHKANAGHSEAPSAMLGLLAASFVIERLHVAANAHLCVLNSMIQEAMPRSSLLLAAQTVCMRETSKTVCGVTAFGVSGVVAHAVARRSSSSSTDDEIAPWSGAAGNGTQMATRSSTLTRRPWLQLVYCRRGFQWRDLTHPLAQRRQPASDSSIVFQSPVAGVLHALVADHVVHGRVIFPGAGYLEMARASAIAASKGVVLQGVFFLQPLAVEAASLHVHA